MRAAEVHKMTDQELREEEARLRRRIFDLRAQAVTEKIENPKQVGALRRDIARILTEQKNRQAKPAAQPA